jgi:hypothetical protein
MDIPQQATLKFRYSAGALIRGEVERRIRGYAFDYGVKIDIRTYSGILESDYHVTINGNADTIESVASTIRKYLSSISTYIGEGL